MQNATLYGMLLKLLKTVECLACPQNYLCHPEGSHRGNTPTRCGITAGSFCFKEGRNFRAVQQAHQLF